MMNARNKSIGSNTPGKEVTPMSITDNDISPVLVKRKLMLQEWAERKGGTKRKIEEESRAAYVEQQLENRAKRFKQLLVNGAGPKTTSKTTPQDKREKTKENRKAKNATKSVEKTMMRTKSRGKKRRRLSSQDTMESLDDIEQQEISDVETVEFLAKLSSPTKKKDNLLGYFQKKESPKEAINNKTNDINIKSDEKRDAVKNVNKTNIKIATINETPTDDTVANKIFQEKSKLIVVKEPKLKEMPKEFIIKEVKVELKKTKDSAMTKLQMQQQENIETPKRRLVGGAGGEGRRNSKANKVQVVVDTKKETTTKTTKTNLNSATIDCAISTSNIIVTSTPRTTTTLTDNSTITLSNSRPRRSCTGKARYDYDLEVSPTKIIKTPNDTQTHNNTIKNESIEVITLDDSSLTETPNTIATIKTTTTKRLAPLFVRAMPKPSPDPVAIKARQDFLHSGVPEKIRLEMEKQKLVEQHYEETYEIFPKVSHIQQLSDVEQKMLTKKIKAKWQLKAELELVTKTTTKAAGTAKKLKGNKQRSSLDLRACKVIVANTTTTTTTTTTIETVDKIIGKQSKIQPLANSDKRSIIKSWKVEFERFPTFKCYNQMSEKYQYFSAIDSTQNTQQLSESLVMTRSTRRPTNEIKSRISSSNDIVDGGEEKKPPISAPNGELLFTEKYKPMLFEQVLVNLTPVMQLRDFLANWSNGNKVTMNNGRNSQNLDDTLEMTNDSSSSQQISCNSVVLLGPVSSGKTNAVFALANEMNFNVLEINAGMKRTGKKMIQELLEATQSHQIRKESTLTTTAAVAHSKCQNQLLQRMSLNGFKSKKKSTQILDGDLCPSMEQNQNARKCLILIEDADIVFEQTDAGFIDAIYTLAASSKRPVIVVASNPNCQHLQRLMQQNTINFNSQNVLNISKFLAILSLMENCPVHLDDLISLYLYNHKDLRRTLLELQFFIQSGGDRLTYNSIVKTSPNSGDGIKSTAAKNDAQFFASPTKRRFSVEPNIGAQNTENDEKLNNETQKTRHGNEIKAMLYRHNTLFDFYAMGQNEKVFIPFPVDFYLLRVNLHSIFEVSAVLNETTTTTIINDKDMSDTNGISDANLVTTTTGRLRKSRSPKKTWLNSANVAQQQQKQKQLTPLDSLCAFYENISTATLLGTMSDDAAATNTCTMRPNFSDRLVPHLAEDIAHELVQKSINVNLAANAMPYNLFDTPTKQQVLCNNITTTSLRTKRAQNLDYEPHLRAICRSEKQRSTQERRSTRFYHYLRNILVNMGNFSTSHFENVCTILQEQQQQQSAEKQQQQITNDETVTKTTTTIITKTIDAIKTEDKIDV